MSGDKSKLLAIDLGNTDCKIGLFSGEQLIHHWRVATDSSKTADEYTVLIESLLTRCSVAMSEVGGVCLSSVVPPLTGTFEELAESTFGVKALTVGPGVRTGISILYDNPKEVGADRVVNAVAAFEEYGGPAIIVDFGTAITFDAISDKAEYLGGVIVPGIGIAAEALFRRAAKLPHVELAAPREVIGKDTVSSMQSGLIYGYVDLVDGMVGRISVEMESKPTVIATGGLISSIAKLSKTMTKVDPLLTLKGLRLIYDRNRK